jgi:hypothetical protein
MQPVFLLLSNEDFRMPADCGPYQWADTETMLQLIAALNLGFSTFKEIRLPGVTEVSKKLEDLPVLRRAQKDEIDSYQVEIKEIIDKQTALTQIEIKQKSICLSFHKSDLAGIGKNIDELKENFDNYLKKSLRLEPFVIDLSLFVTIVSVLLLMYATLNPKQGLDRTAVLLMIIFGLLPVFSFLKINYRIFGKARHYKKRADEIEGAINLIGMKSDIIRSEVENLAKDEAP